MKAPFIGPSANGNSQNNHQSPIHPDDQSISINIVHTDGDDTGGGEGSWSEERGGGGGGGGELRWGRRGGGGGATGPGQQARVGGGGGAGPGRGNGQTHELSPTRMRL